MIIPVTPDLASAMNRASVALGAVESLTKGLNDRDSYPELANHLEDLTVNLLSASSSLSLIGVRPVGARVDFAPDTKLAAVTAECVSYLRNDATKLLRAGSFSAYETKHADAALSRLEGLYGCLTSGIMAQVREDLSAIARTHPGRLVDVANHVADSIDFTG